MCITGLSVTECLPASLSGDSGFFDQVDDALLLFHCLPVMPATLHLSMQFSLFYVNYSVRWFA